MKKYQKPLPTTYLFIYLTIAIILTLLLPSLKLIHPPFTYLGIPFIVFGLWLTFWVDIILKKKKTAVKPQEKPSTLIIDGPFRFSRHPMYLGFVGWLLGLAILTGNLAFFLAPIAMLITFAILFIPYEEMKMEETFGLKYREYKKRVRQWL